MRRNTHAQAMQLARHCSFSASSKTSCLPAGPGCKQNSTTHATAAALQQLHTCSTQPCNPLNISAEEVISAAGVRLIAHTQQKQEWHRRPVDSGQSGAGIPAGG
jgi:hypothetical protein